MKVLIIEDTIASVKGILDFCDEKGWEKEICEFEYSYEKILTFNPDIIVLDWKNDATSHDDGNTILDNIWNVCFRPIVVFSGHEPIINIDDKKKDSNLVKVISKGDEAPVIEYLSQMERFVGALSLYRKDMGRALISSLNSLKYLTNESEAEETAVEYVLSKRTASFFDRELISELSPSWVQYLCPPVNDSLCTCDIIRVVSQERSFTEQGLPEEYLLVLTPSCDMVSENGRHPKVQHVLCAHCFPKEIFHGKTLASNPSNGSKNSVKKDLNAGHNNEFISIPGFSNVLPYMTVDLKKLEMVPIVDISLSYDGVEQYKYMRVASICSPFREQIVWAYMQTACRPGVPDRNTEFWAKEILSI